MLTQEIIRKKRDKGTLNKAEIDSFIKGVTTSTVGEGQIASFCMAVLLNGLTREELVSLTMAMAGSGTVIDWSDAALHGPVLDKHSTGGVGDKVSLMLAPIIAACGGYVPMISGRGLGHTGGTLDKMDSIPGYVSQPDLDKIKSVLKSVGCAIIGTTKDIAPADRTMYAVRDVTGTVESIDLITASILSKKLAAGLQGLVMDVKFGTGAFMQDYGDAKKMAQSIVSVANGAGLPTIALMTDMNEVLGRTAGNAIEVVESIEFLRGENTDKRLYDVTMALCAELLVLGKIAETADQGLKLAEKNLKNGRAADFFGRMVVELGGPADLIEDFEKYLNLAPVVREVYSNDVGVVSAVDTRTLGLAIIELGGGRRLATDKIDHGVGLGNVAALGETVDPAARPLAVIFARTETDADKAEQTIRNAYKLSPPGTKIKSGPAISEKIQ